MTPGHLMMSRGGGADAALDLALPKSKFRYFHLQVLREGVEGTPTVLGFKECHQLCAATKGYWNAETKMQHPVCWNSRISRSTSGSRLLLKFIDRRQPLHYSPK